MRKKIVLAAVAAALVVLALPSAVSAYGAAHVGYTHVGPSGVYHTGRTVAAGPRGVYAGGHTAAYGSGGGVYRSGSRYGAGYGGAYGAYGAYGGYHYAPSYYGGAYGGAYRYRYGYIR